MQYFSPLPDQYISNNQPPNTGDAHAKTKERSLLNRQATANF
jgi:hypothetical protein